MFCFECGKEIFEDSKFCRYCGENQSFPKETLDDKRENIDWANLKEEVVGEKDKTQSDSISKEIEKPAVSTLVGDPIKTESTPSNIHEKLTCEKIADIISNVMYKELKKYYNDITKEIIYDIFVEALTNEDTMYFNCSGVSDKNDYDICDYFDIIDKITEMQLHDLRYLIIENLDLSPLSELSSRFFHEECKFREMYWRYQTGGDALYRKIEAVEIKIPHGNGYVGITVNDSDNGLIISRIDEGSPSHQQGLMKDDVILEVDGKAVKSSNSFYELVASNPNTNLDLLIKRKKTDKIFNVHLKRREVFQVPRYPYYPLIQSHELAADGTRIGTSLSDEYKHSTGSYTTVQWVEKNIFQNQTLREMLISDEDDLCAPEIANVDDSWDWDWGLGASILGCIDLVDKKFFAINPLGMIMPFDEFQKLWGIGFNREVIEKRLTENKGRSKTRF